MLSICILKLCINWYINCYVQSGTLRLPRRANPYVSSVLLPVKQSKMKTYLYPIMVQHCVIYISGTPCVQSLVVLCFNVHFWNIRGRRSVSHELLICDCVKCQSLTLTNRSLHIHLNSLSMLWKYLFVGVCWVLECINSRLSNHVDLVPPLSEFRCHCILKLPMSFRSEVNPICLPTHNGFLNPISLEVAILLHKSRFIHSINQHCIWSVDERHRIGWLKFLPWN